MVLLPCVRTLSVDMRASRPRPRDERSRDAESILREVRDLQQRGFKEVNQCQPRGRDQRPLYADALRERRPLRVLFPLYVYAPEKKKKILIKQLEAALSTIK